MIPTTCKRLIEVDFPIAAVSEHSAREKSIRHGHPSTLHLWWARRPLAACRSVLLGLLLPDPCDKDCPADFKTTARELLAKRYGSASKSDEELRELLLKFIGEFANWDHAANALYLEIGRGLVKAAHPEEPPVVVDPFSGGGSIPLEALRLGCEAFASDLNPVACLILKTLLEDIPCYGNAEFKLKDDLPDGRQGTFYAYVLQCGDGSLYKGQTEDLKHRLKQHEAGEVEWTAKHLPVEMVYYEAFDSREKAVEREKYFKSGSGREWLQKKLQEGGRLPAVRQVHGLADALRHVGKQVKAAAEKELAQFYPPDPDGSRPIAYLWARTVRCEGIGCGAEIPIFKTAWLSKRGAKRAKYFRENPRGSCVVLDIESAPKGGPISLRILKGDGSEGPKPGHQQLRATKSSGNNASVVCPCCNVVLHGERVQSQLQVQNGGASVLFDARGRRSGGAFLLAVVLRSVSEERRVFRVASPADYKTIAAATRRLAEQPELAADGTISPVRPSPNARGMTAPTRYGVSNFSHLFTSRQSVALGTLAVIVGGGFEQLPHSLRSLLVLAVGRCADQTSAHVSWIPNIEAIGHSFPRQALQMVWDFVECVPISVARAPQMRALANGAK